MCHPTVRLVASQAIAALNALSLLHLVVFLTVSLDRLPTRVARSTLLSDVALLHIRQRATALRFVTTKPNFAHDSHR